MVRHPFLKRNLKGTQFRELHTQFQRFQYIFSSRRQREQSVVCPKVAGAYDQFRVQGQGLWSEKLA